MIFYLKLPRWFEIDTPLGSYRPGWALAHCNDRVLYFVAETKGTPSAGQGVDVTLLRPIEQLKIECGKRHFKNFEEVQFKVDKTLTGLINGYP